MNTGHDEIGASVFAQWIAQGNRAWLPIRGQSMAPWLPSGSRVLVAPVRVADVRAGEVVVYRDGGALVCHRSLGRQQLGPTLAFEMKGDAWWLPATPVAADHIIGRVIAFERRGRRRVSGCAVGYVERLAALAVGWLAARLVVLWRRWQRQWA